MGLITGVLTLPLAPVRVVLWLGEALAEQVDEQTRDPSAMRRQVEQIEQQEHSGELTDEQARDAEQQVLDRVMEPRGDRDG